MVRRLIKAILILLVLVAGAFFVFGYWTRGSFRSAPAASTVGTSGEVDTARARERGAVLGEKAAKTAAAVNESIEEGQLTAKIKAKMILDDFVKARTINVTTNGSTVTLTGTVYSQKERDRAVQLAKETEGVTGVIDQLVMQSPRS
jgi:osmotically-inducible protein OsmY